MTKRVKNDSDYEKGRRGIADVVKLSDLKMRVDFHADEERNLKAESFNVEVSFGEEGTVPEYFPWKKIKDNGKISASVTMNDKGTKILFAVPANGYFEVRFDGFVTAKDTEPVIETKQGKINKKTGKPSIYGKFACLFEITGGVWQEVKIREGVWAGARYWFGLYDNFTNIDGFIGVKGAGDGSDNLSDFLDAVVNGGESIPYSENPLPAIQELAKELDNRFYVNVAKGWVTGIVVPLVADDSLVGDDDEYPEAELSEAQKANIHPALSDE